MRTAVGILLAAAILAFAATGTGVTTANVNWPDAINCGNTLWQHQPGLYVVVYPPSYRRIHFNGDGTYQTWGGDCEACVSPCQFKTIQQLYAEGRAKNLVSGTTVDWSGQTSVYPGYPDVLRADTGHLYIIHGKGLYYNLYPSEHRYVKFNTDGTAHSVSGCTSCYAGLNGRSIDQLYSEGKAFNLLSFRDASLSHDALVNNKPDAIECDGNVYLMHGGGTWYAMNVASEYRYLRFTGGGDAFETGGGCADCKAACIGKSLQTLANEGRALWFYNANPTPAPAPPAPLPALQTSPLFTNWPDVINCGNTLWLHGPTLYNVVYPPSHRHAYFNADGSYKSWGGDCEGCVSPCFRKSIDQLYAEGRAFNLKSNGVQDFTGTTSIFPGWPDVIKSNGAPYFIHSKGRYQQVYALEERYVTFHSDGRFNSRVGHAGSAAGIEGKTIGQLYNEGRAFNLVNGRGVDFSSQASIVNNKPDALVCGDTVLLMHGGGTWYAVNQATTYTYTRYDGNGAYLGCGGACPSECSGRSLEQLRTEGKTVQMVHMTSTPAPAPPVLPPLPDPSKSINPNWPDVINCGTNVLWQHQPGRYVVPYTTTYRQVLFNNDGSYSSWGGGCEECVSACFMKSIDQLYAEGRAFNLEKSTTKDATGATSIFPNFPDVLRSDTGALYFIHGQGSYFQVYPDENRYVNFHANGAPNVVGGCSGCYQGLQLKTIDQLYSEGRAFNILGARGVPFGSAPTIIPSWPDAIQCDSWVYIQHGSRHYVNNYAGEYRNVQFASDGSYVSSTGCAHCKAACVGKSLEQLRTEGKTLMFTNPTFAPTTLQPTPNPESCVGQCLWNTCPAGTSTTITVTGADSQLLWGTSVYTTDSTPAAAAVHAGCVALGETKSVGIHCVADPPSFAASLKNGIQSQAFGAFSVGFYFDCDNIEDVNAVLNVSPGTAAPETLPPGPEVCSNAQCLHNKCAIQGASKELIVTGTTSGAIYGSDIYTDDSVVGAAAVHMGVVAAGEQKTVKVTCTGAQTSYTGVERNGVTSIAWGAWQFSFTFDAAHSSPPLPTAAADTCTTCMDGRCRLGSGATFSVRVTGASIDKIWGSDTYTEDSHVGVAAVHAGLIDVGVTATLVATCQGAQSSFTGSVRNGIASASYGAWPGSYSLGTSATPPTPLLCVQDCLRNQCLVAGRELVLTVTGAGSGFAWGVDRYTDDSNVQLAAAHLGLVAIGETATLVARCAGRLETWPGSTRHGVTTQEYNQPWSFSFTLSTQ